MLSILYSDQLTLYRVLITITTTEYYWLMLLTDGVQQACQQMH
jgi:hypothetical protein